MLNKFEEGEGWISKKDIHELAAESGLTISQITTWMTQKRQGYKIKLEILLTI